jgi:hypothetical protein
MSNRTDPDEYSANLLRYANEARFSLEKLEGRLGYDLPESRKDEITACVTQIEQLSCQILRMIE